MATSLMKPLKSRTIYGCYTLSKKLTEASK